MTAPITGIAAVLIPVADLVRSVPWYADLLGLGVSREFVVDGRLWGAVLRSRTADLAVVLQDRATAPAVPDLRGTHPVVFALPSRSAVGQVAERCAALGVPHGDLTDDLDGTALDVPDPDGIVLRFRHVTSSPDGAFAGIEYGPDGTVTGTYRRPRLAPVRSPASSSGTLSARR